MIFHISSSCLSLHFLGFLVKLIHQIQHYPALEKAKKEGKTGVGQNAGIAIGSTEVFAWVIDYYLLDDRKDMEKKAQEEIDTCQARSHTLNPAKEAFLLSVFRLLNRIAPLMELSTDSSFFLL